MSIPGTIQAANFDSGGQGLAYFDTTPGNSGGEYRSTDVDVTSSSEGGYLVGWIDPGEWLKYTVVVASAGTYTARFRVAALGEGGTFHLEAKSRTVTRSASVQIPDTGDWQAWTTVTASVALDAGPQVLRLVFDTATAGVVGNVSWFSLTPIATGPTPYNDRPVPLPGTIHAENFDNGGEGVAYHDTTPGNSGGAYRDTDVDLQEASLGGYNVGWIADDEWLAYTVNVAAAGAYSLNIRVASPYSGGRMHVAFGSTNTSVVTIPSTGGWQTWTTVTLAANLTAGAQVMKVIIDTGGFNIADITVSAAAGPGDPGDSEPSGETVHVPAGGDLQAAIDRARPGTTIFLTPGATYVGNFVLPVKSGSEYVTIRSAAPDAALPGANTRIDPSFAPRLPKLRSPNSGPALATAPGAHHYKLTFLEFPATYRGYYDIIALGDASSAQNSLAMVPHDLIIDRCYVHGDVTYGQKRGVALNSASTSVLNSYIAEIKAVGQDSQAIGGWNGPGPYTIVNNYLEAAGENVMFGGADPAIPNLIPSDITISRNHLAKKPAWRTETWTVKNLFELKNAQRVVVDGNVMEYNWLNAQTGYAILFTPRNQDGRCPWCVVQQVRFTNNLVRHTASGINILGTDDEHSSGVANDITIRNNLFEDVRRATWGGDGRFLLVGNGAMNIVVDHNTVLQDGSSALLAYGRPMQNFVFTNNIVPDYSWAIFGDAVGIGNAAIARYFPGSQFLGGIYVGSDPAQYPAGNYYPRSMTEVGFVNLAGGNYWLAPSSPYRYAATDRTAPGCNIETLNAAAGISY